MGGTTVPIDPMFVCPTAWDSSTTVTDVPVGVVWRILPEPEFHWVLVHCIPQGAKDLLATGDTARLPSTPVASRAGASSRDRMRGPSSRTDRPSSPRSPRSAGS